MYQVILARRERPGLQVAQDHKEHLVTLVSLVFQVIRVSQVRLDTQVSQERLGTQANLVILVSPVSRATLVRIRGPAVIQVSQDIQASQVFLGIAESLGTLVSQVIRVFREQAGFQVALALQGSAVDLALQDSLDLDSLLKPSPSPQAPSLLQSSRPATFSLSRPG